MRSNFDDEARERINVKGNTKLNLDDSEDEDEYDD
jgi:hypothetical protein